MSNPWTRKQQDEEYAKIEAMSEEEIDSMLDDMQSKFSCKRFKEILNERSSLIAQDDKGVNNAMRSNN